MEDMLLSKEELQELFSVNANDLDDMEIFCYCTGTCVTLRCTTGNN